jgi:hypothetical protein
MSRLQYRPISLIACYFTAVALQDAGDYRL